MKNRIIQLLVLFAAFALQMRAVTLTTPAYLGHTGTVTYHVTSLVFYYDSGTLPYDEGSGSNNYYCTFYVYDHTAGDTLVFARTKPSGSPVGSTPLTLTSGHTYNVYLRIFDWVNALKGQDSATINGTADTVRLAGTNTRATQVRLSVIPHGGGTEIGHIDVAAGAAYDQTYSLPSGVTSVDVVVYVPANFSNEVWVEQGTITSGDSTTISSVATGSSGTPTPTAVDLTTVGTPQVSPITNNTSNTVVWNSTNASASTTTATALDKATFREGVTKMDADLGAKLDLLHSDLIHQTRDIDTSAPAATAESDRASMASSVSSGGAFGDAFASAMADADVTIPTTGITSATPSTSDDAWISVDIPSLGMTGANAFKIRPFFGVHGADLLLKLHIIRLLFIALMMLTFIMMCRRKLEEYLMTLYQAASKDSKVEFAQIVAPGLGTIKQVALATGFFTFLFAAIGVSIATLTAGYYTLGGEHVSDVLTLFQGQISDALSGGTSGDTSGVTKVYKVIAEAFPFSTFYWYIVSYLAYVWTLPVAWFPVMAYVKVVSA